MKNEQRLPHSRLKDRLLGLCIITVTFALSTAVSFVAKEKTIPHAAKPPEPPSKVGLPGFPKEVEPFSLLTRASQRTERPLFVGMVADNLESDGTLDFSKSKTKLRFVFQSPPNMGAQPAREGGRLPSRSYCGKQDVRLTKEGLGEEKDRTNFLCGSKDPVALKLPQECSIGDVMLLLNHGKKQRSSRRVKIEYLQTKSGPAYAVYTHGKKKFTLLASDCKTMLKGKSARGRIP